MNGSSEDFLICISCVTLWPYLTSILLDHRFKYYTSLSLELFVVIMIFFLCVSAFCTWCINIVPASFYSTAIKVLMFNLFAAWNILSQIEMRHKRKPNTAAILLVLSNRQLNTFFEYQAVFLFCHGPIPYERIVFWFWNEDRLPDYCRNKK